MLALQSSFRQGQFFSQGMGTPSRTSRPAIAARKGMDELKLVMQDTFAPWGKRFITYTHASAVRCQIKRPQTVPTELPEV